MRPLLRAIKSLLAVLVLLIVSVEFTGLPQPYPTWPTVGPVPIDPELIVPGLLGLVAILGTIRDGITIGSLVIGFLGGLTLWMSAMSLYSLYAGTAGGVFWGGFFTLISGTILAVAVIVQRLVHQSVYRGIPRRIRKRFRE